MPLLFGNTASSGGVSALEGFVGLDSYTFSSNTLNTITFSSIPQGYKHLYLFYQAWGTVNDGTRMFFNGVTTGGGNYRGGGIYNASGTGSFVGPPASQIGVVDMFSLLGGSYGSTQSSAGYAYINDYSKSGKAKSVTSLHANTNSSNEGGVSYSGGGWVSGTEPISSLTLTARTGNFNTGSKISIFGIN
jgi:hypothetical protein